MTQTQFRTLFFLLLAVLCLGVFMLYLGVTWSHSLADVASAPTSAMGIALAAPAPTATTGVASATPALTATPLHEEPATWTPMGTSTPWPTVTPSATPTPSPTATPTAIPTPVVNPGRPTLAPVAVTPTLHPSHTITIPTPVPLQPISKDALTLVLLGSDQRPDWDNWRTDAIQYVVIYPDVPSVTILSIPRDLYIYIPGFWMSRINTADMTGTTHGYPGGGFGLLNQALLYNLGISADYYVKVDMAGLIGLVNAIGGIEMPVHCRLEDYWPYPNEAGEYDWLVLEPGLQHMDGQLALWYARTRKTTSVFSRERRQQRVLEAMWRQAQQANLLEAAPTLAQELGSLYQTNMGLGNIVALAVTAARLSPVDVRMVNIGREQVTAYTTPQGGVVFLPVWAELEPVLQDVLAKPASSRALQAPIPIEVWNGSGQAGWEYLAADWLIHAGYAPTFAPADGLYPQTRLVFFGETTKGSGLSWAQSFFRVRQEHVLLLPDPAAPVKLRLILGQDYVSCR